MFNITHKSANCQARTGVLSTAHGDIETPVFMPVGTQATVKSLGSNDLEQLGAQIILANTYHLHLRPGEELIANFGGLHNFMSWNRPILTDSGGFQVFSLDKNIRIRKSGLSVIRKEKLVSVDNDGVTFKSHLDGSTHRFTPESAIEIQHKLGADIIMAFDECTADDVSEEKAREAMERTHRWAERCLAYHKKLKGYKDTRKQTKTNKLINKCTNKPKLFGIIQGSTYRHLREESARAISSMDFDGIAIGGESVGFNMTATKEILDWIIPIIPENKPRYTMGLGHSPLDLFDAVEHGVDMFDCVSPTRMARNGNLYTLSPRMGELERGSGQKHELRNSFTISITNARFRTDKSPIDPVCACSTCKNYSRAYLHHLFRAEELLAYRLATIHNVHFFLNLMRDMRQAIREDRFLEFKRQWLR